MKRLGLHFGRRFHKSIWSPWLEHRLLQGPLKIKLEIKANPSFLCLCIRGTSRQQGCQIFLVQHTKMGKIYQNEYKIYQMAIKYTYGSKIDEMKCSNIYKHFSLQDTLKFTQIGILLVWKSGNTARQWKRLVRLKIPVWMNGSAWYIHACIHTCM
jgi:hypothetical protein